jgi:hypothetical protein
MPSRLIFCVHEHGSTADDFAGVGGPKEGILEQGRAEAFALFRAVDSQPS